MPKTTNNPSLLISPALKSNKLVAEIYSVFNQEIHKKIVTCFENINPSLFELADKSGSNTKQTYYLDSLKIITESHHEMITCLHNCIQTIFESYVNSNYEYFDGEANLNQNNNELTLIDPIYLDEILTTNNLIERSEAAYHKHLFAFEKRFTFIAKSTKALNVKQIPLGPYVIVNTFKKCINIVDLHSDIKIIMYKTFERSVMGQLNSIYKKINDLFIQNNIVSEIKYNIHQKTNHQHHNTQSNVEPNTKISSIKHDNSNNQNSIKNTANQQNLDLNYQLISQLLTFNREVTSTRQNDKDTNSSSSYLEKDALSIFSANNKNNNTSNIDLNLMINALTVLQNDLISKFPMSKNSNSLPSSLKNNLIRQVHKIDTDSKLQTVKHTDEDTIDLVAMLFQYVIKDRNLPKKIQLILVKLQFPYLKIALQDKNLFADKNHSARVLLNQLALSSIGWTRESDEDSTFVNKITEITHHILEIEEYNNNIFTMLLVNFEDFLKNHELKFRTSLQKTNKKAESEERIRMARINSAQLLVKNILGKSIPKFIKNTLLDEWSSILILSHLRFSKLSRDYLELTGFIENLINFSQYNPQDIVDKQSIIDLMSTYNKGLKLVIFQKSMLLQRAAEFQDYLYKILISSQNKNQINSTQKLIDYCEILTADDFKQIDNKLFQFIEKDITQIMDNNFLATEDEYLEVVSSLTLGTWVKLTGKNRKTFRAKLSWISPNTDRYIFVNLKGYKIIEKSSVELAKGLKDKSVEILLQIALFDRALSSIADDLNLNIQSKKS